MQTTDESTSEVRSSYDVSHEPHSTLVQAVTRSEGHAAPRSSAEKDLQPLQPLRLSQQARCTASEIDLAMMRRALQLAAQAAAMDEVPVGAVVYRGDEIVGEAFNTRESSFDPTAHAELLALRKAGQRLGKWRLSDCSLIVTLEPCPMCAGGLINARIGRLIYGARDPKSGACHSLYRIPTDSRLNHRVEVTAGVMEAECAEALRAFFRRRREQNRAIRTDAAANGKSRIAGA